MAGVWASCWGMETASTGPGKVRVEANEFKRREGVGKELELNKQAAQVGQYQGIIIGNRETNRLWSRNHSRSQRKKMDELSFLK